jgi:hypothetical protein
MDRLPPPWRRPPSRPSRRSARSNPPDRLIAVLMTKPGACATPVLLGLVTLTVPFRDTAVASPLLLIARSLSGVWMMPSAPARSCREPHFLRVLRDYGLSPLVSQNENAGSRARPHHAPAACRSASDPINVHRTRKLSTTLSARRSKSERRRVATRKKNVADAMKPGSR